MIGYFFFIFYFGGVEHALFYHLNDVLITDSCSRSMNRRVTHTLRLKRMKKKKQKIQH